LKARNQVKEIITVFISCWHIYEYRVSFLYDSVGLNLWSTQSANKCNQASRQSGFLVSYSLFTCGRPPCLLFETGDKYFLSQFSACVL
jgi:hypothetical protein